MAPTTRSHAPLVSSPNRQQHAHNNAHNSTHNNTQQQQQTHHRQAGDSNTFGLRMRRDSTDSMRGAFYHGAIGSAKAGAAVNSGPSGAIHHDRKHKRRSPHKASHGHVSQSNQHQTASSMADLADMAMASLGNDTNGYDVYGANPTTAAQHTNTNMSAAARRSMAMQHTPNSHPLAAGVGGYDSIPETESAPTRRSPADNVSHRYSQGSTRDNVRVSEISQGARDSRGSIFSILSDESQNLYGTNLSGLEDSANFQPSPRSEGGPPAPPPYPTQYGSVPVQQREIDMFSSLVQGDFAGTDTGATKEAQVRALPPRPKQADRGWFRRDSSSEFSDDDAGSKPYGEDDQSLATILYDQVTDVLDPTAWLSRNVKFDEDGTPFFDDLSAWTIAGFVRHYLYNPCSPEFTSLQQFSWAVILGILMGFYTAAWKMIIEKGLDFMWKSVPEKLLEIGVFTELDGYFPMYHYMWMTPALFGGVLSYIFVILPVPIPDQNEWINNIHSRGVQDYRTFWTLFFLSTAGMLSGLSLGPELPLVLTAGMLGSRLGLICKQSMLQARVMNLTAASAAVGGFFGFPMAGALFVLEIPHRMGLQYFEALSPATIASIVAVLCNRMVTGNEVTGYYSYPFLTASLPSEIFTSAVFYGFFGAAVGIIYAKGVVVLKTLVHDLFHATHDDHDDASVEPAHSVGADVGDLSEVIPLVGKNKAGKANAAASKSPNPGVMTSLRKYLCCVIPSEPNRAAVAGTLAGAIVGIIGIYVPHSMFWGEAQLQSLIDKGRTPLPVFGQGDEPTAALVALGRCMIDPTDGAAVRAGFSIECALVISVAKIVTTGLSLGTGIIAGHFWGPLFVGCSMSHFLTDVVRWLGQQYGFSTSLATYPCVVLLCTMGSTHVVTFRAHMAIMLILTLTISAFDPEDDAHGHSKVAGDYSAVFPLLVVSVFISLMASRDTVFYKTQRSRGDIMAVPEVLCEPGMEGRPLVVDYEMRDEFSYASSQTSGESDVELARVPKADRAKSVRTVEQPFTQNDIERAFEEQRSSYSSPAPPPSREAKEAFVYPVEKPPLSSSRLDELLSRPVKSTVSSSRAHRRTMSAPVKPRALPPRQAEDTSDSSLDGSDKNSERPQLERRDSFRFDVPARERTNSGSSRGNLVRINSYGELHDHQPSLLDQARMRSASSAVESRDRRVPSFPSARHSRRNSDASAISASEPPSITNEVNTLSMEDIEKSFNTVYEGSNLTFARRSPWTDNSGSGGDSST